MILEIGNTALSKEKPRIAPGFYFRISLCNPKETLDEQY
jgi:hypothetical protein